MTLEVRWVPDAVEDMQGGHEWYEDREPGLGRDFAIAVFDALDQAIRFPLLARRYEHLKLPDLREVRSALSPRRRVIHESDARSPENGVKRRYRTKRSDQQNGS